MIKLINTFIEDIKLGDVSSMNDAIANIREELNIGKVTVNYKSYLLYAYSGDTFIAQDPVFVNDKDYSAAIYRANKNDEFKIDELKIILNIILAQIKNINFGKHIKELPYIQTATGLPNSFGFNRLIAEKYSDEKLRNNYYVLFINLQGLGFINKSYSVKIGDLAIKEFTVEAQKLLAKDEIFAHLGVDNFLALVNVKNLDDTLKKFKKVDLKIKYEDKIIPVSFSTTIGAMLVDEEALTIKDYLSGPSMAMQYAKANRLNYALLEKELKEELENVKTIERTFMSDLEAGKFIVYYQPKVDVRNNMIVGAEALARWDRDGKIVNPAVFIPILEQDGNIIKLDLHILENACKDISHYKKLGNRTVPLSCNLSRKDLKYPDLKYFIVDTIKKYDLEFEDIVIEVTETTNVEEKRMMEEFLNYLHMHNIKTSIDDFGTGYSSLSALRDFKVNEIKIDRSFINRDTFNESDVIILSSIIDMAKRLNMDVICEGVERDEQIELLKSLGCYRVQGYFYDKPLPKLEFEAQLKKTYYNKK